MKIEPLAPDPRPSKRSKETQAKILEAALALYNERGTSAVSTNHVAEAAGLSVGNLYYHFPNREAIVHALFERNAQETRVAFAIALDQPLGLATFEKMIRANYEILWRYRFLYRELPVLLGRDPNLASSFRSHRQYGFNSFMGLLHAFAAAQVLRPIADPAEAHRLAVMVWLVSEYYIPFLESHAETMPDRFVEDGVALLQQVLEPYRVKGADYA